MPTAPSSWPMRFLADTCRLWDSETHKKLDKDRFRRDLGGVEDAYAEVFRRVMGDEKCERSPRGMWRFSASMEI